jgi:hypothetical protein
MFYEATTKLMFYISTNTFIKNTRPTKMDNFSTGVSRTFPSTPHKKTNFCRIGRRPTRFELHVHDIILKIFHKNDIYVHNMLFHQRSSASLASLSPGQRIFMPTVLNIVWNGHKKFKNDPNNVKPSRAVILYVIIARKILKLENCEYHKKSFTKWAIMFEVSWYLGQTTNGMDIIAA